MPEFIAYPLLMEPFYSERPWGGGALAKMLKKKVPPLGGPYGESWELSDHPDGRSKIANGPYEGCMFGELTKEFPQGMLGVAPAPERYPLLIKYIDAAQDLSVQVHPSDATAPTDDRGKTECWYIMHANPGAVMIWGLRQGVDAALLSAAAEASIASASGTAMEQCIQRVPIATGDFVYIPAGAVHATLAGTLLCEVQQSSNTTYRLWDWNRQPSRELHIEQACAVTNFEPSAQKPLVTRTGDLSANMWHKLVSNEFFAVQTLLLAGGARQNLKLNNPHGLILCIPDGSGRLSTGNNEFDLAIGQTWFLPTGMEEFTISSGGAPLRLLLSESRELS